MGLWTDYSIKETGKPEEAIRGVDWQIPKMKLQSVSLNPHSPYLNSGHLGLQYQVVHAPEITL